MKKKSCVLVLLGVLGMSLHASAQNNEVKDIDGNTYKAITIGKQVWMAENLKVTKLNDGTEIPQELDNTGHGSGEDEKPTYCWYNNDVKFKNPYGALYNWYAVGTGKLCPTGWHVPDNAEWQKLIDTLGGVSNAGGKLKQKDTTTWLVPNARATDDVGFNALPAGCREFGVLKFDKLGKSAYFWSSNSAWVWEGFYFYIFNDWGGMNWSIYMKTTNFSVRCLKN